jgi:hypothetical protein
MIAGYPGDWLIGYATETSNSSLSCLTCWLAGFIAQLRALIVTVGLPTMANHRASPNHGGAGCPVGTVALEAGGADTYTSRAIPGSEPARDSCTQRASRS